MQREQYLTWSSMSVSVFAHNKQRSHVMYGDDRDVARSDIDGRDHANQIGAC